LTPQVLLHGLRGFEKTQRDFDLEFSEDVFGNGNEVTDDEEHLTHLVAARVGFHVAYDRDPLVGFEYQFEVDRLRAHHLDENGVQTERCVIRVRRNDHVPYEILSGESAEA